MTSFFDAETVWLNITNLVLGLTVLAALAVFVVSLVHEILLKRTSHRA